jgi:hypothetical protein
VPGTDAYNGLWKPFLVDFVKHLEQKGWLGRTTIAMDERSLDQMKGVIALVQNVVPDLKISLAGKYHKSIASQIHDFSYNWTSVDADTPEICNERRANGFVTTYYSACGMAYPNSFTFSPPAEQAWIGWFAASRGFDGFLRWAYNSWVKDPLTDTRHIKFPAGDCFQVYPGHRSSIRFERLREGIQDYEKIRILKKLLRKNRLQKLIAVMQNLEFLQDDIDLTVSEAKRILEELSRAAIF